MGIGKNYGRNKKHERPTEGIIAKRDKMLRAVTISTTCSVARALGRVAPLQCLLGCDGRPDLRDLRRAHSRRGP